MNELKKMVTDMAQPQLKLIGVSLFPDSLNYQSKTTSLEGVWSKLRGFG